MDSYIFAIIIRRCISVVALVTLFPVEFLYLLIVFVVVVIAHPHAILRHDVLIDLLLLLLLLILEIRWTLQILALLLLLRLLMMVIVHVVTVLVCRYEYTEGVLTVHAGYTVDCAHSLWLRDDAFLRLLQPLLPSPPLLFLLLPLFFLYSSSTSFLSFSLRLLSFRRFFSSSSRSRLVPSCACILSYFLFSPHLIFAKASSRLAGVRGPKFRSPPPWVSIFKGSHLFSSFCLLFLRFLHRPASSACPLFDAPTYLSSDTPFTPTVTTSNVHTASFLSSTG